ncbi:MAG: type II toxin-antitoxin system PemK/MazF family toxin [Chloroflexi bacterium]|nr:type II toxin-antitoxin system PemK/MazF family toxin [Chloroflexota bacterium]
MRRTRSTTLYDRGDVVLVNFVFSEETGVKRRPAVIVSSAAYHQGRQETIIAAITSNVDRMLIGDHLISQWREAGLIYPSVVTGLIRTIKRSMIARRLGSLGDGDQEWVDQNLMVALGLKA